MEAFILIAMDVVCVDKEDRVDQEYRPQESVSENGDSDVDGEVFTMVWYVVNI